ncbi:septin-1-like isoform X2, partial [Dinothrombium tinctorium]
VYLMKALHKRVNIIPIIAKSDALTKQEIIELKKNVMRDIEVNGITIYSIPDCDSDEDEEYKEQIRQIKAAIPFAVSSSLEMHDVKGRKVQGRLYPWGVVETENADHSDFVKLRSLLVTHMQDLREVTQEVHYENYRSLRLTGNAAVPVELSTSKEDEINDSQKDRILQEKEAELRRMQEMIAKMQEQMKQQQLKDDVSVNGSQQ